MAYAHQVWHRPFGDDLMMVAMRLRLRLADVLLRFFVERLLAARGAEVIRLPFVFGLACSFLLIHLHAAHRVFCHTGLTSFQQKSRLRLLIPPVTSNEIRPPCP